MCLAMKTQKVHTGEFHFFCGVHDVVGMMTARAITTILRLLKPIRTSIVVMTLAVIMLRKNMKLTLSTPWR